MRKLTNYPPGMTGREAFITGEEDDDFFDPEMEAMMAKGEAIMSFWEGAQQRNRVWQMRRLHARLGR